MLGAFKVGVMGAAGNSGETDPDFASVVLLLQPSAGDSAVTDKSGSAHTVTEVGDAGVSASDVTGFGGRAIVLDGTGDWLTLPYSTDFAFGTGDFTIEAKIRQDVSASNWSLFDNRDAGYADGMICGANGGSLRFYDGGTASNILTGAVTINADTTYDVCWERSGNTWRLYLDGSVVASTTDTRAAPDGGSGDFFTGDQRPGNTYQWDGHYTLRVTKGVARYQGAYTPPARFPTS